MNAPSCQAPVDWGTLLEYWLGELACEAEAHVEEHYLGCVFCSGRLEQLAALAQEVRTLTRSSGVNMVINDRFVQRLAEGGLRVREYRVPLNGSVSCTVTPEDDFVVGRLEAALEGVSRVDMVTVAGGDGPETRQEDIPFVPESGAVLFAPRIGDLRALPATVVRVRLFAVDAGGERMLGEYRFNHTSYDGQRPE